MSVEMIAITPLKYKTRRLLPGQSFHVKSDREARVLAYMKKAERAENENRYIALDDARAKVGMEPLTKDSEDIATWREKYVETFDRRPFNGWSIEQLKEKIANA